MFDSSPLVFGECGGGGQSSRWLFPFTASSYTRLGKVAGNLDLLNLWLRSSGPGRQDSQEVFVFFLTYTSHWLKVLVTVL